MNRQIEAESENQEWSRDHNYVSLWGSDIQPGTAPKIRTVAADLTTGEPLKYSPEADSGGPSPPATGGEENATSTGEATAEEAAEDEVETASSEPPYLVNPSLQPEGPKPCVHYIVDEQFNEVLRTARGLLQTTDSKSQANSVDSLGDQLHVQYAGKDGDSLLDDLVEDVARKLGCSILALDAQDIADLISRRHSNQATAQAGRMLSYNVLTTAFPDANDMANKAHDALEEDDDGEEDHDHDEALDELDSPASFPRLDMSFLAAKPGDILKSLMRGSAGPGGHARLEGSGTLLRMIPDFADSTRSREESGAFALSEIISRLLKTSMDLSTPSKPPEAEKDNEGQMLRDRLEQETGIPKGAIIVHVKDFRAIQSASGIGRSFLNNLQRQLSQRRRKGERWLFIGTDSARDNQEFTTERINETQAGWAGQQSQTIVITPHVPNQWAKAAMHQGRKKRIATINLRHLWETLRHWKPSVFEHLQAGFWRRDFFQQITLSDKKCLEENVWSYQYIQRLASYIAGVLSPAKDAENEKGPPPIVSAAISHLNHSDKTKMRWAEQQAKEATKQLPDRHVNKGSRIPRILATASKYEKKLLSGIIEAKNITTTFDDVHMPVETIDALQTLTTLSLTRPDAFKYGVLASNKIPGLMLYGPPGTGKTLAAKAVAKESGATMLEVSAADLNDMYVGEGEKNIKALFSLARKLSPCVVFLDEADAMFRARSNQGPRVSHREQLNQFLKEWDGMNNDSGSAFIMVATNRPMDLDEAVLRRLPRRLLVDLPTEADRLEILKIHLRHETLAEDVNFEDLAKKTPFYSGSDLKNVAVAAALNAVREENELAKKHTEEEAYKHPERRTLTKSHFDKALEEISASISEDMASLRDIKKFDEQYGDKRGKKKKVARLGFPVDKEHAKNRDTIKVRE
jgi:SpoVK/Ycf46/Vps4 family AAA+-type ATPase